MNLNTIALLLTDQCNFDCVYCYQKNGTQYLDPSRAFQAIDYFYEYLADGGSVSFSGGEPLLAFDLIEKCVEKIHKKKGRENKSINFAITTNGSLLDEDILDFLERNKFSFMLSFDGLQQDEARHSGSLKQIEAFLPQLLSSSNIKLTVNSVFSSDSCSYLSNSVAYILDAGVTDVRIAFSFHKPWSSAQLLVFKNEMALLRKSLSTFYESHGFIPVENFQISRKGIFNCYAGKDRLALAPDGKIWGCYLFSDYYKSKGNSDFFSYYCFGDVEKLQSTYQKKYFQLLPNYERLSSMYSCTNAPWCISCQDWFTCVICPLTIALSTSLEAKVPSWVCEINKTVAAEKKRLWQQIDRLCV